METGDRLLEIFDPDPARAEDMIRDLFFRLVKFFAWRHCPMPEDLAQETLRRGFGRIQKDVEIYTADPAPFFFGIARNVLKEEWKGHTGEAPLGIEDLLASLGTVDFLETEARICLDQCLQHLPPDEREMLSRYISEDPVELARELRLSPGNLRVKAHRATRKLTKWVQRATMAARVK
jgi:DNA-directed RNA polymerase specialized sigma24 family protein